MIPVPYKLKGDHHIIHVGAPYLHVGGPYIHMGDHMICVPYKGRADHQIMHVGDHTYMWGTIQYLFHIR